MYLKNEETNRINRKNWNNIHVFYVNIEAKKKQSTSNKREEQQNMPNRFKKQFLNT